MSAPGVTSTATRSLRAKLWRRRLFEAESGLTRFFVEENVPELLDEWIHVKAGIFENLPSGDSESDWQRTFFRAQALMERFLVAHFGHDRMADWARSNAYVYATTTTDSTCAQSVADRFVRQLANYDSETEVTADLSAAMISVKRCGIWQYRERARARGVPITLASPCEYCTKATAANFSAKGYASTYELTSEPAPGCRWTLRTGADGTAAEQV
ncbi:hypothetical protein [Mycobacteroides immunogenum]|uniref:Uncharacterized protein n=1 Tax=Mycobacteroides immunogenum TaxID=83262 RepID=A0A7V8LR16_9MYCO|nr:hypothetical protein [Mycobacteroides immunogenum]AMT72020.1 hypothetical protein ABG82_18725 [Mycobacteroides immunogenum]ANO05152.1 hypothetical protein BAB75_18995 [Mycobacteroides immunogenum]KPG13678.1 hypothetical protein AN909_05230 [Mycobacteroides immunogenum]KPG14402.1 hypothetical protein AN908_07635 [Mycobacteroides immunogenum]KPG17392.1 hypothetical protein AN910_04455 [Mycobacteroides immunogenum]